MPSTYNGFMPVPPEILSYIQDQHQKGTSTEQIRSLLLSSGWQEADIATAFNQLGYQTAAAPSLSIPPSSSAFGHQNNNISPSPATQAQTINDHTLIAILLLIFVWPLGVIVMWIWTKWKTWVKLLVTFLPIIPFVLIFVLMFGTITTLMLTNPDKIKTQVFTNQATDSANSQENNFNDKSQIGESCFIDLDCESDICAGEGDRRVCTEGKTGDSCFLDMDCNAGYCVNKICSDGNNGDSCEFSMDCKSGLTCESGSCQ